MSADDSSLGPDCVFDGYRPIRFLGRGGFGEVWLCQSEVTGGFHAIKFISEQDPALLEKELHSLVLYRNAAAKIRSPHLVSIEHINRNGNRLYYVMPLADGGSPIEPTEPGWEPLSLAAWIEARRTAPAWFSSREITGVMRPLLEALQTLSDAGLVHRDVKPENILFFNGSPCLGDISLLGHDAVEITRRGTPGYATPSWYREGLPDMFGAAATLYSLLTGNPPDKMGRAAFLWPPQGEASLSTEERADWTRLHAVIRRATEEKVSERFVDFKSMMEALDTPTEESHRPIGKIIRNSRASKVGVGAAAVALLTAVVAAIMPKGQEPKMIEDNVNSGPPELTEEQKVDYQALVGLVLGYLKDGHYANSLASVEQLLSTYPQARTQSAYSVARAMALSGLGRTEEAKEELRKDVNLSPNISAMTSRKDLWEQLGELEEAEKDISRVLNTFGPATFPLYLRADIRLQRGDPEGAHRDRKAAYAIKVDHPEQKRLVDAMWAPLEAKYESYAAFVENEKPTATSTPE